MNTRIKLWYYTLHVSLMKSILIKHLKNPASEHKNNYKHLINIKIQNAREKVLHTIINIFVENETIKCMLFYFCQ